MIRKDGVVLGGKNMDTTSESFRSMVVYSTSACARYLIDNGLGEERAEKFEMLHRMVTSNARKFRHAIEEYLLRQCDIGELESVHEVYYDYDTFDEKFQTLDQFMSNDDCLSSMQWLEVGVMIANKGQSEDDLGDIYILGDDYSNMFFGYVNATRYLVKEITCVVMDMVALTDPEDLEGRYDATEIIETLDLLYEMNIISDIFNN